MSDARQLNGDSKEAKKRQNCDYKHGSQTNKRRYVDADSNLNPNFDTKSHRTANCDLLSSDHEPMSSSNSKFVDINSSANKLDTERDNELSDLASDDDDFCLNYEPILARILDEKKLVCIRILKLISILHNTKPLTNLAKPKRFFF